MENDLNWFYDLVKGLGLGGGPVFAALYFLERKERKEMQGKIEAEQKDTKALLVQSFTAATQIANSLNGVANAVSVSQTAQKESDERLAQMIQSILKK